MILSFKIGRLNAVNLSILQVQFLYLEKKRFFVHSQGAWENIPSPRT
jgi:hypothetical protein